MKKTTWLLLTMALAIPISSEATLTYCYPNLCNSGTVINQVMPIGPPQRRVWDGKWSRSLFTSKVVYLADTGKVIKWIVYAVHEQGGTVTRLSRVGIGTTSTSSALYDYASTDVKVNPQGTVAVYRDGRTSIGDYRLWSVGTQGGGSTQISIYPPAGMTWANTPASQRWNSTPNYEISCDGQWVKYEIDTQDPLIGMLNYYVGIQGGASIPIGPLGFWPGRSDCTIFVDGFDNGNTSRWN